MKGHHIAPRLRASLAASALLLLLAALSACSGRYAGMPRAEVLGYQTNRTYGDLHSLASAYGQSLNQALKADTLHPGMFADYGVALALMGHKDAACRMLNAEVRAFPQSRAMVLRIKQRIMPDMIVDTMVPPAPAADMNQLTAWAYDSLAALQPLPYVAPIIDSTDTLWLQMQTPVDSVQVPIRLTATQKRLLLEEQQAQEALRKQATLDSIAAAKQAKVDARKQAKADREKAKKEQEKARKQAKKDAQKEKERQAKERQRQAKENSKKQ